MIRDAIHCFSSLFTENGFSCLALKGEVAERSEDGEGCALIQKFLFLFSSLFSFLFSLPLNALSVTFGDSSPKGRAKKVQGRK